MILNSKLAPKTNEKLGKVLDLLDKALRPYDLLILEASTIEKIEDKKIKENLLQIEGGISFVPFLIRWGSKNKKNEYDIQSILDWFDTNKHLEEVSLIVIEGSKFDLFILQEKKKKKKKSLETQLEEVKETFSNE